MTFVSQTLEPYRGIHMLLWAVREGDAGIRPGVPVQVSVRLRPRTALRYRLDPLAEGLSRSFAER